MSDRTRLKKFSEFAVSLLPHETSYLLSVQQFQDDERLRMLETIHQVAVNSSKTDLFDVGIDKRKYSHLKNWIEERLADVNVDFQFDWITTTLKHILTDSLTTDDERKILKLIRSGETNMFYFTKFFELLAEYRQFLLIRLRYQEHNTIDQYITTHQVLYDRNRDVFDKLHNATQDIINHYSSITNESIHWETWLTEVFYDESLEGYIRYMALVRLTFVHFNYRDFEGLVEKYNAIDKWFVKGKFYSKRILLNYYSNRVLLHARFKEYDKAVEYGYLSIRQKNNDYIHYVNNLCAILLRTNRNKEALQLMRDAYPEMRLTPSFHNKIGFISFYMRCLMNNQQYKNAENYAETFLKAYRQEIFKYRWHIFFTAYLEAILNQNKYEKIIKVVRNFNLLEKDKSYQNKATYLPTISWYYAISACKEGLMDRNQLSETIYSYVRSLESSPERVNHLETMVAGIKKHIPGILPNIELKRLLEE
ncbi:MAG TPA: hypothetical protein PLP81_03100 [Saprospiraceae bacterium]|nr:hypothetical protein [Saprospiraceae bacterium]HMX85592.1 hypothetical protein [Saprospiraceae bacterium]HNA41049.1 hypothetical protein [Saprospiraceae bacterium]HNE64380.1 hypothetical protein [Saprospiraceae bacterium]HNJ15819.1 hypothetical protein [Saprospiraceae bacterium]